MTDDKKKPSKPDPFAPLPLADALTGPTSKTAEPAPAPEPAPPQLPPAAPLPPTAFTRPVSEHDTPVVPFEASAYEAQPEPEPEPEPEEAYEPPPEPAYEPPLEEPAPSSIVVENELRDAIGVIPIEDKKSKKAEKKKKKRASTEDGGGDEDDRPRSRLWMLVAALAVVIGGGISAMVLVGRSNSERLVIACEADRVVILQGRSFPPWGESALEGAEWKPLKIPAEAPCAPFETKDKGELAAKFEKMLEDRATKLVGGKGGTSTPTTAVGPDDPVAKVDEAEANLKQALLVTRWLSTDNDRITKRELLERLLGDVTYWRASARLRVAGDALMDAAKQFDAAALQKPRANTDAESWANHMRRLADELHAGPNGVKATESPLGPPTEPHVTSAPLGVALPVEPSQSGSAAPPPPVDAGVVSTGGGVLL